MSPFPPTGRTDTSQRPGRGGRRLGAGALGHRMEAALAWRGGGAAVAGVVVVALALASANAFVQDDAFISFRYARNLVEHGALTWNPDEPEPIEGYTNFLWTILMTVPIALGLDPVAFSQGLGLLCFLATLLLTARLARRLFSSRAIAVGAIALLGTNYTAVCFATGGLETQLQTLWVVACAVLALAPEPEDAGRRHARALGLSAVVAGAMLTRLDSVLLCGPFLGWAVWRAASAARSGRAKAIELACLTAPALLVVGGWLAWKVDYYGALLPNTFHAKVPSASWTVLAHGAGYLLQFVHSYLLLPFVVMAAAFRRRLVGTAERAVTALAVGLWLAYVVRVGGDYMEFRMLAPVLPMVFAAIAFLLSCLQPRWLRAALAMMLVAGSVAHASRFRYGGGLESVTDLKRQVDQDPGGWRRVGRTLGEHFADAEPPVRIATTAAGAIPYYSRLPTVDMLGLNDRWVARHGWLLPVRAGHRRIASVEHLASRGVHLVLGHPQVFPVGDERPEFHFEPPPTAPLPAAARVVYLPLGDGSAVRLLLLAPHPRVEAVIRELALTAHAPSSR